jgi:hypothetical protein
MLGLYIEEEMKLRNKLEYLNRLYMKDIQGFNTLLHSELPIGLIPTKSA